MYSSDRKLHLKKRCRHNHCKTRSPDVCSWDFSGPYKQNNHRAFCHYLARHRTRSNRLHQHYMLLRTLQAHYNHFQPLLIHPRSSKSESQRILHICQSPYHYLGCHRIQDMFDCLQSRSRTHQLVSCGLHKSYNHQEKVRHPVLARREDLCLWDHNLHSCCYLHDRHHIYLLDLKCCWQHRYRNSKSYYHLKLDDPS